MKIFTKKLKTCNECPNSYRQEQNGFFLIKCSKLKRVLYDETEIHYNEELDEIVYPDEIPKDCPLPNTI